MARLLINMISELSNIKEADIDLTTTFKDIGFDVIDLAELIMLIEDKLKINASIDTYYSKTVGELINHINKNPRGKAIGAPACLQGSLNQLSFRPANKSNKVVQLN